MNKIIYVGIDPGKSGALVAIDERGHLLEAVDMPLVYQGQPMTQYQARKLDKPLRKNKYNTGLIVDAKGVRKFLRKWQPAIVTLEQVTFRGAQTGLERICNNFGYILQGIGFDYCLDIVYPNKWSRGLPKGKQERKAICHARRRNWDEITNEGKTDAALIALWQQQRVGRVCGLMDDIYSESAVGGNLHIVLDDGNVEDHNLKSCKKFIRQNHHEMSSEGITAEKMCLAEFEKMTPDMRMLVYNLYGGTNEERYV